MLTIRALMDILATHDPDTEVMVDGYENGAKSLTPASLSLQLVRPNPAGDKRNDYDGDHVFARSRRNLKRKKWVLLISRGDYVSYPGLPRVSC